MIRKIKFALLATALILVALHPLPSQAQTPKNDRYTTVMKAQIHKLDTAITVPSFLEAAGILERVSTAEPEAWLPAYYTAYAYLNAAVSTADTEEIDLLCASADRFIVLARERPDYQESELLCLESLSYLYRIRVDYLARGLDYSARAEQLLNKAQALDDGNPRVAYLQGRLILGKPKSFGGGLMEAMPQLKYARKLFDAHDPLPLEPDWGRQRLTAILSRSEDK